MRVNIVFLFLSASVTQVMCEFKLLLLHTNDMHARFQETNAHSGQCTRGKCYGGFARVKTAVEEARAQARQEGRGSIFLNAGDSYQGTVFYSWFKHKVVSELVNMLGLDAVSLGNHEFDDGPEGLVPFIANSSVPIVCCNIDYSKEPAFNISSNLTKLVPSVVLSVEGTRIGVIGYLTPDTKVLAQTGLVELTNEVLAIQREVTRLKQQGVKILIALGHSGFTADKLIAQQVPDLDIVVGGHTNTFLYNGPAPSNEEIEGSYPTVVTQASGRKVLVVQAYAYTKYLGQLKVTFNDEGEFVESSGNPILLDESVKQDGAVQRAVLKYENIIKEEGGARKVGISKVFLEADHKSCRTRECNFGNLVTDALIDANLKDYHGSGWTDIPIAFVQGGGLRSNIDVEETGGAVSYLDILTSLPFENTVESLKLSGSILRKVLENSVSRYSLEERPGGFLQYSGIHVVYDLSKPAGSRVVSAKVRCGDCPVPQYSDLEDNKLYQVMTTSFLSGGGDFYDMLKDVKDKKDLSFSDRYAVETYLGRTSPVHPEISGRIILLDSHSLKTNDASLSVTLPYVLLISCAILTQIASKTL